MSNVTTAARGHYNEATSPCQYCVNLNCDSKALYNASQRLLETTNSAEQKLTYANDPPLGLVIVIIVIVILLLVIIVIIIILIRRSKHEL